jgi:hypothetical protein
LKSVALSAPKRLVPLAGLVAAACSCARDPAPAAAPVDELLAADRRVSPLLADCARSEFYDRDLSDIAPVLLEKLERARPDPLKRAKEELGALGLGAFPGLANAFHANYSDLMRSPFLENVVDALAFSATDEAHELLLEALLHPQESVRAKALDGFHRNSKPTDFDVLAGRLAIETHEIRRQTISILFRTDRPRAEDLILGFFADGSERDLWQIAAPELAQASSPEAGARCANLYPAIEDVQAAYLAAGAARHGHAAALSFLRVELRSEEARRRLAAVNALERAGLVDELAEALRSDPLPEVRAIAASALGAAEPNDQRRDWLRAALNDASEAVQTAALVALCAQDDDEGLARAFAQLDGHVGLLQSALTALRTPLRRDPELAARAYERLRERHALEEHRPLSQRAATLKAIGQMPLAAAAEWLHELGVAAGDEVIESLRAHDWLMIHASNTDQVGRARLAELLLSEDDPLRRLDLIDAVGSARDELARTFLLAHAEHGARSPLERLFTAYALIRVGPSWDVAPRLKRVAYAMQTQEEHRARTALQCLLWYWY